ncbi:hypothetical protein L228DRAFT_244226 [Xylona heveae TC161]|uniref:Transcription initiation factor Rrn11 n=1 Tax=Xylona heveae (strain CBS 132557 / TC161) TaxID=1328760 RepID=A0A165IU71_XYLHT|nr:hypothetical protein L228DRAFT_244226 [Xylona heveae TC161]KZF25396.1 hypothetical protein L228DRAFT_244226 [Xylona heveae TC161]
MAPSLFALPLTGVQHPETFRTHQLKKLKKRKRDARGASDEEDGDDGRQSDESDADGEPLGKDGTRALSTAASSAHLSAADASQYRLAGHSYEDDLPGGGFPHGPAPSNVGNAEDNIQEDLAALNPPLYVANTSSAKVVPDAVLQPGTRLRRRHLAVLIAIMHRCLLEGDFVRAGRAWGMLLRMELRGDEIDIRAQGRWGLGAEILFRKPMQISAKNSNESTHNADETLHSSDPNDEADAVQHFFSSAGFDQAREYYERLILQHPFRKQRPHSVSSIDFYPAMFGLWVFQIEEPFKSTQRLHREEWKNDDDEYDEGRVDDKDTSDQSISREMVISCLRRYEELVTRLEELLLSPPYSDTSSLWQLRGMVALRMADLYVLDLPSEQFPESDDHEDDNDAETMAFKPSLQDHRRERENNLAKRQRELGKARLAFQRAKKCGGQVWEGVQDLLHDPE